MEEKHTHPHPWKTRLISSLILIVLAFLGLILTDVEKDGGWFYWRFITPFYAVVSLYLSWYLRTKKHAVHMTTIWKDIFHWVGLILSVYLVSRFVSIGIMGRFEAGLIVLSMLALTTFLAGIYIEITFVVIGLLLGFFAYGIAFLDQYLYAIMVPLIVFVVVFIFILIYHKKRKIEKNQ